MGQNDLEKLLQRVLNEVQYKQVRGFLDTEAHHPSEFLSHISAQRQTDFVIKTAKNQQNMIQLGVNNGTPTSALMAGVGTPGSLQSGHIARGQNATKQMRAMGAAKGTLRTGPIHNKSSREN